MYMLDRLFFRAYSRSGGDDRVSHACPSTPLDVIQNAQKKERWLWPPAHSEGHTESGRKDAWYWGARATGCYMARRKNDNYS